ncbi:MAG: hypothetical protein AB7I35_18680 [Ramlibacter sp.]
MRSLARVVRFALPVYLLLLGGWALAQVCAVPQNNGTNVSTAAGQTVNGYFTPNNGTYTAGSQPTITLSGGRGSATWSAGDLALLIQMQCVDMDRTESDSYGDGAPGRPAQGYLETSGTCRVGQYEYVPAAAGTSGTSFVAGAPLQYTYVQANPTSTTPRRSFQVIRVPQYGNLTLGGTLTGLAWNGTNGGVLALDVAKTMDFGGQTIDMSARGFRGGGGRPSNTDGNNPFRARDPNAASQSHASKGEGIAGTPRWTFTDGSPFDRIDTTGTVVDNTGTAYIGYPGTGTTADFDYARGAPGNAGGGGQYYNNVYHNGGGGGGANGGAGGRGGFGWRSAGWAGVASDYSNIEAVTGQHLAAFGGGSFGGAGISRVVMGGGGGAGDQNGNSNNTREMSGSTGGGIVLIRAGALTGGGTIDVRGGSANTNPLNDAAGAGAAGGSVIVVSPNWTSGALTVSAYGGQGGDAWLTGTGGAHSGGGGGGGGVVVRTGAASVDINGGANGVTNTSDSPPGGADHGALPGNAGVNVLISEAADPVSNSGYKCLPLTDLSISKAASTTTLSIGQTTNFTLTIGNSGPQQATAATVVDVLPAGLGSLALVSASGSTGPTTLTSSSISGSTFTGTVTIPVNQTLTVVLRAVATANGAPVNTGSVSAPANASDTNLGNNSATATVVIGPSADLSATKVANTPSLVVGQTTTFTLTFVNPGPSGVTGARITDTLPTGMGTLTFVSASIAGSSTLTSRTIAGSTFNGTATLPVGSTLTVVLRAVAGAIGAVINTTTIAPPAGTTDTDPSNNSGTATVNIGPQADLSITKSASPTVILPDQTTVFTVTVRNLGPNTATAATFNDTLPSGLAGMTITAVTTSGASATVTARATVSSQANATMTLPPSSSITFTLRAIAGGVGEQVNVATVTPPAGVIDPVSSNNTAQATVTIPVSTNITVTKTNTLSSVVSGSATVYGITVTNNGPNSADGTVLADPAATGLSCTTVSCTATGGAICPSSPTVAGLQSPGLTLPTFPASSTLVFLVTCDISATGS